MENILDLVEELRQGVTMSQEERNKICQAFDDLHRLALKTQQTRTTILSCGGILHDSWFDNMIADQQEMAKLLREIDPLWPRHEGASALG